MKTRTFAHLEWWLFLTVPLGHYVGWMEWLTFLNVGAIVVLNVVVVVILMTKMDDLMIAYEDAKLGEIAEQFKFTWRSAVYLLSMGLLYQFGWELSAWLCLGSWVIIHLVMRVVREKHNESIRRES